jgi:hypothetical protein
MQFSFMTTRSTPKGRRLILAKDCAFQSDKTATFQTDDTCINNEENSAYAKRFCKSGISLGQNALLLRI